MTDQEFLAAYTKGVKDARADIADWLRLLASIGNKIVDAKGIAGRIERGEYEG